MTIDEFERFNKCLDELVKQFPEFEKMYNAILLMLVHCIEVIEGETGAESARQVYLDTQAYLVQQFEKRLTSPEELH